MANSDHSAFFAARKKRLRQLIATFVVVLPSIYLWQQNIAGELRDLGPVIGIVVLLLLSMRSWTMPCPACGKQFGATTAIKNPFATKCAHCGLAET